LRACQLSQLAIQKYKRREMNADPVDIFATTEKQLHGSLAVAGDFDIACEIPTQRMKGQATSVGLSSEKNSNDWGRRRFIPQVTFS
jgi:hypothetical protein